VGEFTQSVKWVMPPMAAPCVRRSLMAPVKLAWHLQSTHDHGWEEPMSYTEETYKSEEYRQSTQRVIDEFRANGGKVGGILEGVPVLLLTTIGAKSGQPRTTPVAYLTEGDRIFFVSTRGDMPSYPSWYHNLRANPNVTVELGEERFAARAAFAQGEERQRLFDRVAAHLPPAFAEFMHNSHHEIPVVVLERLG
jgi:deazaflavin-dependent oxidoreductase (nitroreductase family)